MSWRLALRSCLVSVVAALLAVPLALQQGYSDDPCPLGTERVVNTGACAAGPGGSIVRNKVGKLMDIERCTTYKGREYDEATFHGNNNMTATSAAQFNVSNDRDVGPTGDIASIVDGGNCVFQDSLGTRIDPICVVKQFYVTHQDVYDFVSIWPNFNHAEGSFHNHVKNDVQGINVAIQDNSATYGTQNLKSLVLFRNFVIMPSDPYARITQPAPNNDSPMSLMAQETGHRWAAWVRRDKDPGPRIRVSTDLLGRNEAHWCFYLDGPSNTTSLDPSRPGFSSMEGNRWFENPPGTFTTILKSDGYSKIDQYLMGFRPSNQVGTFVRLDTGPGKPNPDCSHQPFTPGFDTPYTFTLPKINVEVDDIIRVEGARAPDAQTSQKNWRIAFILLTKAGVLPTASEINKLETFRTTWEPYFQDEAGGGRMFTKLGPVDMDGDTFLSNQDCDEQDPTVNPAATEICDGIDNDCDGLIDEGFDVDGDLYTTCNGDCNDNNFSVNPGATEVWNGLDDNCDGAIDNVNLIDADGDGYYANPQDPAQTDCDDSNAAVHPNTVEIVNGFDDNCNGLVDCAEKNFPTFLSQSDSGPRGNDGFDNDCNGIIDG